MFFASLQSSDDDDDDDDGSPPSSRPTVKPRVPVATKSRGSGQRRASASATSHRYHHTQDAAGHAYPFLERADLKRAQKLADKIGVKIPDVLASKIRNQVWIHVLVLVRNAGWRGAAVLLC